MSKGQFTFARVPRADIPRSAFIRNHSYKTTFDAGSLIPFFVDEALPGDTFNVGVNMFARMSTPIVPILDNLYLDVFFFAVPNRLVWDNWQKFMGEQENPGDSTDYLVPSIDWGASAVPQGSTYDYLGLPVTATGADMGRVSALPLRAIHLIWNEWFRDQNLQDSVTVPKGDGPDGFALYANLLRRGKRHDYFTSCLPWPQKGPGVEIPIAGSFPVMTGAAAHGAGTQQPIMFRGANGVNIGASVNAVFGATAGRLEPSASAATGTGTGVYPTNLYANISGAGTINDLRTAFQLQKMYERDARGGTRYVEILKAHFGVTSPDARLQRPEYLGGTSIPVHVNPVMQTSASPTTPSSPENTPQGNLAAYATVGGRAGFTKSFVEHSIVLGFVSVRADLSYQNGLSRMWSRSTKNDFYWPVFAHLGEQAVLNKEINATGATPNGVFGYQERWAEYRYHPSLITGLFRSNAVPATYDYWHLAQNLVDPVLDSTFIQENPPVDRVVAVPSEPQFLFDSFFKVRCVRPMPMYSVPGLVDHF